MADVGIATAHKGRCTSSQSSRFSSQLVVSVASIAGYDTGRLFPVELLPAESFPFYKTTARKD